MWEKYIQICLNWSCSTQVQSAFLHWIQSSKTHTNEFVHQPMFFLRFNDHHTNRNISHLMVLVLTHLYPALVLTWKLASFKLGSIIWTEWLDIMWPDLNVGVTKLDVSWICPEWLDLRMQSDEALPACIRIFVLMEGNGYVVEMSYMSPKAPFISLASHPISFPSLYKEISWVWFPGGGANGCRLKYLWMQLDRPIRKQGAVATYAKSTGSGIWKTDQQNAA